MARGYGENGKSMLLMIGEDDDSGWGEETSPVMLKAMQVEDFR